jgi:glycosyltransferase involved in cell wall biosynthesis
VKKVLIITHLSHASPRIPGFAKYLPECGWQPIILTTPISERSYSQFRIPKDLKKTVTVIETHGYRSPYGIKRLSSRKYSKIRPFLKSIYKYYREIAHYPDAEKRWKPFAIEAGSELLQNKDITAILSSSSPVTSHLIAKELKEKHKITWVAELRDLWTQNHNYPYSPLRKFFEQSLERETLLRADALVTLSSPDAEKLRALHEEKRIYTITNGFDPDKMSDEKVNLTSKFTITYTGQIYTKQDPSKFLVALKSLISDEIMDPIDVEVRFYGPRNVSLTKIIQELELSSVVKQCGIVPIEISLLKQRDSQLLILFKWEDQRYRGVYSGKIFEYLAAKRPILATGGTDDVITKLLSETNAGIDAKSVEEIKNALRESYTEYKVKGKINYPGIEESIQKYSYREIAKRFAQVLSSC